MPDAPQSPPPASNEPEAQPDESPEPMDMLAPLFRETPLPPEGAEAPPMWLWMIIFGTMLFATFYLGNYIGDFSPDPWLQSTDPVAETAAPAVEETVSGSQIYSSRCANCHQANGMGVPNAFPPLSGARWVEDEGQIIRILLHGMQGPVDVLGDTYNGNMPAWGSVLSDEEIAAVITHVRQSWDNSASEITGDDVAAVREATAGRVQPWTAEELNQDANRTVPTEGTTASRQTLGETLYADIVQLR